MKKEQMLFEELMDLRYDIQSLASIVQNDIEKYPPTKFDIERWGRKMAVFYRKMYRIEANILNLLEENLK